MANLFPEIEVFTTKSLWIKNTPDWTKSTPLKFAKNMKVLDLTGFGEYRLEAAIVGFESNDKDITHNLTDFGCYGESRANFEAVLRKVEADEVEHIGLVSFPLEKNYRNEGFEELEYIKNLLSRATVDHLILPYSRFFEETYTICDEVSKSQGLRVNDTNLHTPINVYLPHVWCSYYQDTSYHFVQSQKDKTSPTKSVDDVPELRRRIGPKGCLTPVDEDRGVEVDKTITVFLPNDLSSKPPLNSKVTQALSLQDFPQVEVRFDDHSISDAFGNVIPSYYENTKDVCSELGITTEHDWPIDQTKPPKHEFTRDAKSICHDSTMGLPVPNAADLCTLPNLSDVLNKISPHHVVRVAVLDTGALLFHKAFADKSVADKSVADAIVAMKNFVPNGDNDLYYDVHGHGTHCAGTVLQTAPFVRLVICKVLDSQGRGQPKWAADAIDWLLRVENCPVDIISMSLGSDSYDSEMRRAVSEAVARGKVVVAAASNDGRKGMTNIGFPARLGDVICVGSHDSCGNGQPSSFSSIGRELDFLAPGEDIVAPDSSDIDNYQEMSGTSQATPIVAGIAAMVISYAETVGGKAMRNAVSNTTVVREIFRKMASKPGHHDEHMGYGNLDPWRLFKYGPDHFRQEVEEIVGPLPVLQPARRDAETQTAPVVRTRTASDSELEMKKRM